MNWTVDEGTLAVTGTVIGTFDTSGVAPGEIAVRSGATIRRDDGLAAVVLNGGWLTNQGTVESSKVGDAAVEARGKATVANSGVIQSAGMAVRMSGDANVIENMGTVRGDGEAVVVHGQGNDLVNTGLIETPGTGTAVRVHGTSNTVSSDGLIQSGGIAVDLSGERNALITTGETEWRRRRCDRRTRKLTRKLRGHPGRRICGGSPGLRQR
jgi:hypothetical protein